MVLLLLALVDLPFSTSCLQGCGQGYANRNVLSSCYSNNEVIRSIYKLSSPLKPGAAKLQF